MKYRTRTFYTAQQRALMWECYSRGESVESIAKLSPYLTVRAEKSG